MILFTKFNSAKEVLIYADSINYDNEENIIAKGNAKIFFENQFIISDLIIYKKKIDKILLPTNFTLKDDNNNFFEGTNGYFDKNLNDGKIENAKIRLNDGSRIVGKTVKRKGDIDIISKGVYSPCKSRIKIANFICPTWQLEGEKILHDNKNLFLYQKHSKLRIINTPVFYLPYLVTPSPLRKERKSGFLTPSFNFNFFDTKVSQSTSFPYYFNIDIDKELTFTPTINYGGGVDSSQRFSFDYNQIISGGNFNFDLTFDSNLEKEDSDKWLSDASLITSFSQNLNDKFRINFESELQTAKDYIQIVDPNSDLSYKSSLSTKTKLEGYNLYKIDDNLSLEFNLYHVNQDQENDNVNPTVIPYLEYNSGTYIKGNNKYNNKFNFYNIIRDNSSNIHAKGQQKISYTLNTNNEFISKNSKINISSETHNQIFNTDKKLITKNNYHSGTYYRFFPILGISSQVPFKFKESKYNFTYSPHTMLVLSPGLSNSSKISNEESSINSFSKDNFSSLNRYTGSDKLDNSKRLNYGIDMYNENINISLNQYYEFTKNSNFHKEQGNNDYLSDILGNLDYSNNNLKSFYNFRFDTGDNFMKKQNLGLDLPSKVGEVKLSYLDQKSKTDEIITSDKETFNYEFNSSKILNYSKINFSGLYDLKKDINSEYTIGYSYFDECFGINLDFNRKSYKESDLKPQDVLTIMFSFKNIGSYKSTNLLSDSNDKLDIEWESISVDNDLFN